MVNCFTGDLCARVQASLRRNQIASSAELYGVLSSLLAFTHFVHTVLCVMGPVRDTTLRHD